MFKLHNVLIQVLNWEFDNCPLKKKKGGGERGLGLRYISGKDVPLHFYFFS